MIEEFTIIDNKFKCQDCGADYFMTAYTEAEQKLYKTPPKEPYCTPCLLINRNPNVIAAKANHYKHVKLLKTGEVAGVLKQIFTCGLFIGINPDFYRTRFCYDTMEEAEAALSAWDGFNDPPGNWIKQKGGVDRANPNYKRPRSEDR